MKIREYLQAKYRSKYPTTCLWIEGKILGIPYPLQPAWLVRYGEQEITDDQLQTLKHRLSAYQDGPQSKAKWAAAGLFAIERRHVIERSVELFKDPAKYSSEDWVRAVAAITAMTKNSCSACGRSDQLLTIKHLVDVPALFLDYDNLVSLCTTCTVKDVMRRRQKLVVRGVEPKLPIQTRQTASTHLGLSSRKNNPKVGHDHP